MNNYTTFFPFPLRKENAQAGHSWTTWRADLEVLAQTLFK